MTEKIAGLSPRERQVLKLVVDGKTSKAIGALLGVESSSVDTYRCRCRLMAKLGVKNVVGLVRLAVREKVIRA